MSFNLQLYVLSYKDLFLRKKSSRPPAALDMARVEKGEGIPDNMGPKSYHLFLSSPTIEILWTNSVTELETRKISQQMGFVTRFLNGASQEIKVKLNESWLQKFYQVKQLKENSTENSAEKNFKEDSQFNELWNISTKQKKKKKKKKKRKILKFKELCFSDPLSDKFQQIALKFATLYLFYPFLSCYFFWNSFLKTLLSCGTDCLNLLFEITF